MYYFIMCTVKPLLGNTCTCTVMMHDVGGKIKFYFGHRPPKRGHLLDILFSQQPLRV